MHNVFITGLWRSGTSLLLRLLDGHPQLCVMATETGIIAVLEKVPGFGDELKKAKSPTQLLCLLAQNPILRFQDIIRASLHGISFSSNDIYYPFEFDFDRFAAGFYRHVQGAFAVREFVYGYYRSLREAWVNCETPKNSEQRFAVQRAHRRSRYPGEDSVQFVIENLQDIVVVELVRHPVWQINSAMKNSKESLEEAVVAWAFAASEIKNRRNKYMNRYKVVQYERLVGNTDKTMVEIADFVGLEMNECLLIPSFNKKPWKGNSLFGEKNGLELTSESLLSDAQTRYIQKGLRDYMNDLQYDDV